MNLYNPGSSEVPLLAMHQNRHNSGIPYTPYSFRVRIRVRIRLGKGLGLGLELELGIRVTVRVCV